MTRTTTTDMARLASDSDGDLPELDDLLKNSKETPRNGAQMSKRGTALPVTTACMRPATGNSNNRGCEGGNRNRGGNSLKSRKRVLERTSDNPLLRPITRPSKDLARAQGTLPRTKVQRNAAKSKDARVHSLELPLGKVDIENEDDEPTIAKLKKPARTKLRRREEEGHHQELNEATSSMDEESDGLSDFIVNDSTCLDGNGSDSEVSPPQAVRRLIQRRGPLLKGISGEGTTDLNISLEGLTINDDHPACSRNGPVKPERDDVTEGYKIAESDAQSRGPMNQVFAIRPQQDENQSGTETSYENPNNDNAFTLRFSPPGIKLGKVSRQARFVTPPASPEPKQLTSPKKLPRIPLTPHRPSMDSFWQQDVINDWNDEFSPQKPLTNRPAFNIQQNGKLPHKSCSESPDKNKSKQDRVAKNAKKLFMEQRHELAELFLAELDTVITSGQISKLAASTGGIKIIWSKKLNTTAGRANWKRETIKTSTPLADGNPSPPIHRHHAAIELAEKVIDDEDRLLNVIAHEFCHLANFMISNIKTNPHGKEFKAWATKCSRHFGNRGIEVTTKHSYTIDYKYVWECENCGTEFKRHSKSIDPTRHLCGVCKGKLLQTKPIPRITKGSSKATEYQLFFKENMKKIREENPGSPQKEIMGIVGKKYQEYKASKSTGVKLLDGKGVSVREVALPEDGIADDDVSSVTRKLDFLDLTISP